MSRNAVISRIHLVPPVRDQLGQWTSIGLDLVRIMAAFLVVVGHAGHREFSTGFRNRQALGTVAVPVFFVVSGFVIRFITRTRERSTLRVYLMDRAARMYSVILPAALLTILLTALCRSGSPVYFEHFFARQTDHPGLRTLLNLTFLSQSWGRSTIFLINTPFWSLSYECLYYLGYGLFFYLRGSRRVICLLMWGTVAGPQVLFLLPVWALGCWIYENHRARPTATWPVAVGLLAAGWMILRTPSPLLALHVSEHRATMQAFGTGVMAGGVLLALLHLTARMTLPGGGPWLRGLRFVADGTFALYLLHYPLMVLTQSLGLFQPDRPYRNLLLLVALSTVSIVAAKPFDMLKIWMKTRLKKAPEWDSGVSHLQEQTLQST